MFAQDPSGDAASEAQKHLVLYELDLGLNHVIRKWSEPVDNGANLLIPVPGGGDGPGGVLICAENFVIYKNQDHPDVRAVLPRRSSLANDRGVLIIATATHRTKSEFFIFVQVQRADVLRMHLSELLRVFLHGIALRNAACSRTLEEELPLWPTVSGCLLNQHARVLCLAS